MAHRGDPDVRQDVFQRFLDSPLIRKSGQKVGMFRWAQVFFRMDELVTNWYCLLAVLVRACMKEDWMMGTRFHKESTDVAVDSSMPGVARRTYEYM